MNFAVTQVTRKKEPQLRFKMRTHEKNMKKQDTQHKLKIITLYLKKQTTTNKHK